MTEQSWSYIGRDADRVVVAARVDTGCAETAKAVAKFIRQGLTVERVPTDWVRQNLMTDAPYIPNISGVLAGAPS